MDLSVPGTVLAAWMTKAQANRLLQSAICELLFCRHDCAEAPYLRLSSCRSRAAIDALIAVRDGYFNIPGVLEFVDSPREDPRQLLLFPDRRQP